MPSGCDCGVMFFLVSEWCPVQPPTQNWQIFLFLSKISWTTSLPCHSPGEALVLCVGVCVCMCVKAEIQLVKLQELYGYLWGQSVWRPHGSVTQGNELMTETCLLIKDWVLENNLYCFMRRWLMTHKIYVFLLLLRQFKMLYLIRICSKQNWFRSPGRFIEHLLILYRY